MHTLSNKFNAHPFQTRKKPFECTNPQWENIHGTLETIGRGTPKTLDKIYMKSNTQCNPLQENEQDNRNLGDKKISTISKG